MRILRKATQWAIGSRGQVLIAYLGARLETELAELVFPNPTNLNPCASALHTLDNEASGPKIDGPPFPRDKSSRLKIGRSRI
jgi:hypothetical protein